MRNANEVKDKAERLARAAGMQFDGRYGRWVAARGQFEGEPWYAPYYWDAAMNGEGETISGSEEYSLCADLLTVDGEESEAFGLECGHCVLVRQDSQGFVIVTVHASTREAEKRFNEWIGG